MEKRITERDAQFTEELSFHGPMKTRELAARTEVSLRNTLRVLARLLRSDKVTKRVDEDDYRTVWSLR